jgi:hypothetical protein
VRLSRRLSRAILKYAYVTALLVAGMVLQLCAYAGSLDVVGYSVPSVVALGAEESAPLGDLPGQEGVSVALGPLGAPGGVVLTSAERELVAGVVAHETSDFEDQLGVAQTVWERMRFYGLPAAAILEGQFASPRKPTEQSLRAVSYVFDLGVQPMTPAPTHFANLDLCDPSWAHKFLRLRDLGRGTVFFRNEAFDGEK